MRLQYIVKIEKVRLLRSRRYLLSFHFYKPIIPSGLIHSKKNNKAFKTNKNFKNYQYYSTFRRKNLDIVNRIQIITSFLNH